jgi:hypothetical protein
MELMISFSLSFSCSSFQVRALNFDVHWNLGVGDSALQQLKVFNDLVDKGTSCTYLEDCLGGENFES